MALDVDDGDGVCSLVRLVGTCSWIVSAARKGHCMALAYQRDEFTGGNDTGFWRKKVLEMVNIGVLR